MMKKNLIIFYSVLVALIVAGCSKHEEDYLDFEEDWVTDVNMLTPIEFELGCLSKRPINSKEELIGKKFGVYAVNHASEAISNENLYINNVRSTCLSLNGDVKLSLSSPHYYDENSDELLNFYSYHPFTPQVYDKDYPQFSEDRTKIYVYLDLADEDILYANAEEGYSAQTVKEKGNPSFAFRHVTSGVRFAIEKEPGTEDFAVGDFILYEVPTKVQLCVVDFVGDQDGRIVDYAYRREKLPVNFGELRFIMPDYDYKGYLHIGPDRFGPITISPEAVSQGLGPHKAGHIYNYKFIIGVGDDGSPTVKLAKGN